MANFATAGGTIYVCSPCFKKRRLDENNLMAGATHRRRRQAGRVPLRRESLRLLLGLLLLIRQHIDPLERGQLLEFRSTEISVEEDLPAWCRMTGNELVSLVRSGRQRSFLVCKGALAERVERATPRRPPRMRRASHWRRSS